MKLFYSLFAIILFSLSGFSQSDTLWFDFDGKYATPETADYYQFRGGSYVVDGKMINDRNAYYSNGQLMKEVVYERENKSGPIMTFKYFDTQGESRLVLVDYKDKFSKKIQYSYHNTKGKLIAQAIFDRVEGNFIDGKKPVYYKDDNLKIKSIITKKNDLEINKKDYFKNGKLAHEFNMEHLKSKEAKSIYFDKKGKKIGELIWSRQYSGYIEKEGKRILQDPLDFSFLGYETFKNQKLIESRTYQQEGSKFPGQHVFTRNDTFFTLSYFNSGQVDTLTIVQGYRMNGVIYSVKDEKFTKSVFLNHEMIEEIEYYTKDLHQPKKHSKGYETWYYVRDNSLLGKVSFVKDFRHRKKPNEGNLFHWDKKTHLLKSQYIYEKGELVEEIIYAYRPNNTERYCKIRKVYEKPYVWGNYTETSYFLNGNIQSITKRKKNRLVSQKFYDQKGKDLPTSTDKDGERITYTFFDIPDLEFINLKIVWFQNQRVEDIKWYSPELNYTQQNQLQIREHYKRDGKNFTYKQNGQIQTEGTRVKGKPFDGALYKFHAYYNSNKLYGLYQTYKNGKLHGVYKRFNITGKITEISHYENGKLHGMYTSYYKNGKIKSTLNYKNGLPDGPSKNFDINETKISENSYSNGKLINGQIRDYKTGLITVYKNGKQVSTLNARDNKPITTQEMISENKTLIKVLFDKSGDVFCDFHLVNNELHGPINYNNTKGKTIFNGEFENGTLTKGEFIYGMMDGQNEFNLVHVKRKSNEYTLKFYDQNLNILEEKSSENYREIAMAMAVRKMGVDENNDGKITDFLKRSHIIQTILSNKKNLKLLKQ